MYINVKYCQQKFKNKSYNNNNNKILNHLLKICFTILISFY